MRIDQSSAVVITSSPLRHSPPHKLLAGAVRPSFLLAPSEEFVSLIMLKWQMIDAYEVPEVAVLLPLDSELNESFSEAN